MTPVLLDTHAWVWALLDDQRLSKRARLALAQASLIYVSPVSFFEIGQKVRLGKWPEMEAHVANLVELLDQQGGIVAPLTPEMCLHASMRNWPHRDPFDRILASSAELMGIPLVSQDTIFEEVETLLRIW